MAEVIFHHSVAKALEESVVLWSLGSTQFPKSHQLLLNEATARVIESISSFALNARRSLEILPRQQKFQLTQPRWIWEPTTSEKLITDFGEALNQIIHAQELKIGFERLPDQISIMDDAVAIPYVMARTDRKKSAFIDSFALAHTFLYQVYPELRSNLESI